MTSSIRNILRRYWPFLQGIHRSPVNSPHKGQWRGAFFLSAPDLTVEWQSWDWWSETPSRPSRRYCNASKCIAHFHYSDVMGSWRIRSSGTRLFVLQRVHVTTPKPRVTDRDQWMHPTKGFSYMQKVLVMSWSAHDILHALLLHEHVGPGHDRMEHLNYTMTVLLYSEHVPDMCTVILKRT